MPFASPWHGNGLLSRFKVTYTFRNQAGIQVDGSQTCDNQWLLNKLEPGSEITVAYLPRSEKKSLFLEPYIG